MDEVPQTLAQLLEQAVVVTSPTHSLALVATMTIPAKVVARARIQLNGSPGGEILEPHRGQLGSVGWQLFTSGHFCPSDITMGCQMADSSRVQVSAPLVHFSSWIPVSKATECGGGLMLGTHGRSRKAGRGVETGVQRPSCTCRYADMT